MTKPARLTAAAAAPERALASGTRVDDYEIESTLAETGVSIVYRAFDLALGVHVALEEYMPEALALRSSEGRVVLRTRVQASAFDEGRQAFIGEAQALARCEHPALLRYERILQRNATAYRAMRLYRGPTLQEHRRVLDEPVDAPTLRRWFDDLLGALAALHADGRVHGALSPARIVLRDDGHLLLLDFDAVRSRLISGRTQEMMAALQPSFAAPEQRRPAPGQAVGPWSDLYALAVTLRYCIDGEPPPPAAGLAAAQPAALVSAAWLRTNAGQADDAPWLRALDACLAEAPQDRPQSVAQLREMIDAAQIEPQRPVWPAPRAAPLPMREAELWPANDGGTDPAPAAAPATAARTAPAAGAEPAVAPAVAAIAAPAAPLPAAPLPAATAAAATVAAAAVAAAAPVSPAAAPVPAAAVGAVSGAAPALARAAEPAPSNAGTPAPVAAADPAPTAAREPAPAGQTQVAHGAAPDTAPDAGQAAIAVVMADLEETLARVTAMASEEADTKRPSGPADAAVQPALATAPASRPATQPWYASVSRRTAAWIAAAAVVLVTAGLVLSQGERLPSSATSSVVDPVVSAAVALPPPPSAAATPAQAAATAEPEPAATAAAAGDHAVPAEAKAAAPPAAARPQPAPRAQCTGKSGYALYQCMQTQCAKRAYTKHPQCVRLRRDQSLG